MSPEAAGRTARAGLTLASLALLAAGPAARPTDGGEDETVRPVQIVLSEAYSGLAGRRREVVRDEGSWARLWAEIHAGAAPTPALPPVDFSREMLIAVASGTRRSGGFKVKVERVTTRGGKLEVAVLETCPPRGARVSLALTKPVEVVRLPKLAEPPTFKDSREPSCR